MSPDAGIAAARVSGRVPMHYLAPGLVARETPAKDGLGVYATRAFAAGTLLCVFGGHIVDGAGLAAMPDGERRFMVQVEHDLFQLTLAHELEAADYINHSCEPNAGLQGQISLVALRAIAAGEEICLDYAMTDAHPDTGFACLCGTASCRGVVRPDDWRLPELRLRYAGHFSPYIQRMIDGGR